MAEYIECDLALQEIDNLSHNVDFDSKAEERGWNNAINLAVAAVAGIPIADVRPERHGRWLINCDGYYPYCSECKNEPQNRVMTDFCPNCGAKMDGKDSTE